MTQLDYWIEETDNLWIKVPIISANSTKSLTITKKAGFTPNGTNTFPIFAGYSTNPFQTGSINADGSIRISKDNSYYAPFAYIDYPNGTFNFLQYGFRTKFRMKASHTYARPFTYFQYNDGSTVDSRQYYYFSDYNNYVKGYEHVKSNIYFEYSISYSHSGSYVTWEIEETPTNAKIYKGGSQIANLTISPTPTDFIDSNRYAWRTHGSSFSYYIDIMFLFVSKYSENHPTISVTDLGGDSYKVEITNSTANEFTDYHISVDAASLGTLTTDESLEVIAGTTEQPTTPTSITVTPETLYTSSFIIAEGSGSDASEYHYEFYDLTTSTVLQDYSEDNTYQLDESLEEHELRITTKGFNSAADPQYSDGLSTTKTVNKILYMPAIKIGEGNKVNYG